VDADAHRLYPYPLEGAHRAVPCDACHREMAGRTATAALVRLDPAPPPLGFRRDFARCADCHEGPHGDQFEGRRGGDDCAACHGLEAFAPASRFDHNRDAAFSLKGAHQTVPCERCHAKRADTRGVTRVVYRPVDARCESCHARGDTRQ
jgi:hypothetical protein